MDKLLASIAAEQKIRQSSKLFIEKYKLKEHSISLYLLKKTDPEEDPLPPACYYGTVYLIRNDTIFGFHSSPVLESVSYGSGGLEPYFKCTVDLVNVNDRDVDMFVNKKQFLTGDELVSYSSGYSTGLIKTLMQVGYKLYTK